MVMTLNSYGNFAYQVTPQIVEETTKKAEANEVDVITS